MNKIFVGAALLLTASACMAQTSTPLSLAQAVDQAIRQRPEIRAAASRARAGEALRQQSKALVNPRLVLQSEDLRASNFAFGKDDETYGYIFQHFETSGARGAREALASADLGLRELDSEQVRREIGFRVRRAYWAALAAEVTSGLYDESVSYFEQVVQYHEARLREGKLAEVDLLRVQLQAEQIKASASDAQLQARRTQLELAREMGLAQAGPWMLTEKFDEMETPRQNQDPARPRIELQLATKEIALAQARQDEEQAKGRPDLDALFGYKRDVGLNTAIVGVQLNLPLLDRNRAGIAAASAEVESTKSSLEATQTELSNEVLLANRDYASRLQQVKEVFGPLRDRAIQIAEISRAAYGEGGLDLLRLLDAERLRIDAQLSWVNALTQYHLSVVELERAQGVEP
jgi:outer membrane protein, heavy metal efflux system